MNVKMNYFDSGNYSDENDISQMSSNGTACMYVSGEGDKIGMVT